MPREATRDISGGELAQALRKLGDTVTRRKGSHMRLTTQQNGEHHVSVPAHDPLKPGLPAGILDDVAEHFGMNRDDLLNRLSG